MREAVFLTLAVAAFVGFVFAPDGADEPENAAISQAEAERVPAFLLHFRGGFAGRAVER